MEIVVNIDEEMKMGQEAICVKSGRANAVAVDNAELRAGPTLGQGLYLVVSGPAPENGGQVILVPDLVEHAPEYRKIEVTAQDPIAINDDTSIDVKHYEKSMPLAGLSGTKGIELFAANGTQKFDLVS